MYSKRLDPHFFAVTASSSLACEMLDLLPETDFVEDLKTILNTQFDICCCMVDKRSFGDHNIDNFIDYLREIKIQIDDFLED